MTRYLFIILQFLQTIFIMAIFILFVVNQYLFITYFKLSLGTRDILKDTL